MPERMWGVTTGVLPELRAQEELRINFKIKWHLQGRDGPHRQELPIGSVLTNPTGATNAARRQIGPPEISPSQNWQDGDKPQYCYVRKKKKVAGEEGETQEALNSEKDSCSAGGSAWVKDLASMRGSSVRDRWGA